MFRVSMLTLFTGAITAVFSYALPAAQWITLGREQGYVPAEVPAEVTDPPVVPAAVLTLIVFAVGWLVRAGYHAMGASDFRGALAGEAAKQAVGKEFKGVILPEGWGSTFPGPRKLPRGPNAEAKPQHAERGREIIANRSRRKELVRELAEAEAERLELVTEQIKTVKEERDLEELIGHAELAVTKTRYELDKREKDREVLRAQRRANESRACEITERLTAIQAVKGELQQEQRELI